MGVVIFIKNSKVILCGKASKWLSMRESSGRYNPEGYVSSISPWCMCMTASNGSTAWVSS